MNKTVKKLSQLCILLITSSLHANLIELRIKESDLKNTNTVTADDVSNVLKRKHKMRDHIATIILPDSIQVIGEGAFAACNNLKSISFHNVQFIEDRAFWYCSQLSCIDLPRAQAIGESAFAFCQALSDAQLRTVS